MCRRARRTMHAGGCHRLQRRVLGSATANEPVRQISWNQPTRASATQTVASQTRSASSRRMEPVGAGILESADVVFDVGSADVHVEGDGVAGDVGVVTPIAEQHRGKQALLGAWVPTARGTRSAGSRRATRPGRVLPPSQNRLRIDLDDHLDITHLDQPLRGTNEHPVVACTDADAAATMPRRPSTLRGGGLVGSCPSLLLPWARPGPVRTGRPTRCWCRDRSP